MLIPNSKERSHINQKIVCSHEGCTNNEVRGGVSIRHGAKKKKKSYKHEGCTNQAKKGGVCIRHGAKKKKKTCSHEGLLTKQRREECVSDMVPRRGKRLAAMRVVLD